MKLQFLSAFVLLCAGGLATVRGAVPGDAWRDAQVNAINRLPMHASFFAYENAELARRGDKCASERYLSLNGDWKFAWAKDADERPTDFYRMDYNDGHWATMPVPGLWEVNGYGDPLYVNIGYAWREQFPNNPPEVPVENNHVGSYRREIEIPASWKGRQIIAHFGSVTSNISLWVNGSFVGYSEDSKLEAEFDITRYVRPGRNLIAFQVFRWCDGSYLEDQDFWRLSGVGRDCYLYSRERAHIADVRCTASLEDGFTRGVLRADLTFPTAARGDEIALTLTAPDGTVVAEQTRKIAGTQEQVTLGVEHPKAWTAETPDLYRLALSLRSAYPPGWVLLYALICVTPNPIRPSLNFLLSRVETTIAKRLKNIRKAHTI